MHVMLWQRKTPRMLATAQSHGAPYWTEVGKGNTLLGRIQTKSMMDMAAMVLSLTTNIDA